MATGMVVIEFVWHHSIPHPRIPPTGRKRHRDIFYTSGVIACFVSNFVAMTSRIAPLKIWLTSFDSPTPKTPVRSKHLRDISYTSRVIADFVLNFVAMATGLVVVEFIWHHSIAHLRIPPTRRKRHRDIFYTSGVVACFVSNFVAMATGVDRGRICLASFNRPSHPKNSLLDRTQTSQRYLLYRPSYSRFCLKFRCHGNGGWSW